MTITICLAQSKGGTAKTMSALNIAAVLVQKDFRVLAIDLDRQANLSRQFDVEPGNLELTVFDLLTDDTLAAGEVILSTSLGADLLPASEQLDRLESSIKNPLAKERKLNKKLKSVAASYDFIIIDTPPNFEIATINAMVASNYLLCPVQPEPFCLEGMQAITQTLQNVQEDLNPKLELLGVFITRYNARLSAHKQIAEVVERDLGDLMFNTYIRDRTVVLDAVAARRPVVLFKPDSDVALDYTKLTEEVLARVQKPL